MIRAAVANTAVANAAVATTAVPPAVLTSREALIEEVGEHVNDPRSPLRDAVRLGSDKLLNPERASAAFAATHGRPVLIVLAAGKGTRFGTEPKCVQPVGGKPLARHAIDAFGQIGRAHV